MMQESEDIFSEMKDKFQKYFDILKSEFGEEIGMICGVFDGNYIEIDLLVGDKSEKVIGIRILDNKKGKIETLTALKFNDQIEDLLFKLKTIFEKKENKIKISKDSSIKSIKQIVVFRYKSENLPINHEFEIYLIKFKQNKQNELKFAKMSKLENNNEIKFDEVLYFMTNEKLSKLNI